MQTSNKTKPQGLIKAAVKYVVSKEYDRLKKDPCATYYIPI